MVITRVEAKPLGIIKQIRSISNQLEYEIRIEISEELNKLSTSIDTLREYAKAIQTEVRKLRLENLHLKKTIKKKRKK
jgi:regulator of replication initiation timing